jgi:hypothetical protein
MGLERRRNLDPFLGMLASQKGSGMGWLFEIVCDRCDYRQRLTERPRVYRFASGQTDAIEQTPAWCDGCGRVECAERLPSLSEIEEQISAIEGGADWVQDWLAETERTAEEMLHQLQELKESWTNRHMPPKCLECGSTSIEVFPKDGSGSLGTIAHRNCGGWLRAEWVGHALIRELAPEYSPEGDRLA